MLAPFKMAVQSAGNGVNTNLECRKLMGLAGEINACTGSLLGTMIWSLGVNGLWPLPSESEILTSADTLDNILAGVEMVSQESHGPCHTLRGSSGLAAFRGDHKKLRYPEYTRFMEQHLHTQASRSGLAEYQFDVGWRHETALNKVDVDKP
jgi:hypothetical protein